MKTLGKTVIEIVTMEGSHKYDINREQGEYLYLKGSTLLGEPLRFNKKDCCLEYFNEASMIWDIYIADHSITQINLY